MSAPPREAGGEGAGRIFISYRRQDAAYPAGWLFDRLADRFGPRQVFKDVDSIELGDDFVDVITSAVARCDVLLAVIGDGWLTAADERGRRRLDDPEDFVRLEIEAALARAIRVIPVLVGTSPMPKATDLPPSLAPLVRRHALEVSPNRFDADTARLLRVLGRTLAEVRNEVAAPVVPPAKPAEPAERAAPTAELAERVGPPALSTSRPSWRTRLTRRRVLVGAGVVALAIVTVSIITTLGVIGDGTSHPRTPAAGSSSTTVAPVFRDDFSGRAGGWADGTYVNGEYRITVKGSSQTSAPYAVQAVYPTAPPNLEVDVDAREVTGPGSLAFGIGCRNDPDNGSGYQFLVGSTEKGPKTLAIQKWDAVKQSVLDLKDAPLPDLNTFGHNHLRAVCVTDPSGRSVHLTFTINSHTVEVTDTNHPRLNGSAEIVVGTDPSDRATPGTAAFDNFSVSQRTA